MAYRVLNSFGSGYFVKAVSQLICLVCLIHSEVLYQRKNVEIIAKSVTSHGLAFRGKEKEGGGFSTEYCCLFFPYYSPLCGLVLF